MQVNIRVDQSFSGAYPALKSGVTYCDNRPGVNGVWGDLHSRRSNNSICIIASVTLCDAMPFYGLGLCYVSRYDMHVSMFISL